MNSGFLPMLASSCLEVRFSKMKKQQNSTIFAASIKKLFIRAI